ncbi:hypothetical protein EDD86DRAFT_207299 [Gorgonomyces haynaldii]|nr:hypothetical protein EDD86DRAFT_207299 [Gorgonomyces haynaldii]
MSQQSFWSTGISSNGIRYVVTLGVYSFYCLVFLTLLLELQLLKQIIHLSNWYSKSFASAIQTGFCVFHLILLPSYWLFAEYASKNQWNADVHPWAVAAVSIYFGALFVWQHIQSFVLFRWIGQHLSTERKGNDPIRQQSYEHLVSLRWSSISLLPADWACLILAIVYRDTSMALSAEIAMLHCVRLLFWMNGLAHLESDTFFVPARRL